MAIMTEKERPNDHIPTLPAFINYLKYLQASLSVALAVLSAYQISIKIWSSAGLMLFSSLVSLFALTYFFLAIYYLPHLYNWIAFLILECVNVLFWLVSWILLAAGSTSGSAAGSDHNIQPITGAANGLERRDSSEKTYGTVVIVLLSFGVVNWLLYCVTLTFISLSVHRHRKSKQPMSLSSKPVQGC